MSKTGSIIRVDEEFYNFVKEIKEKKDLGSNRRATKEILYMIKDKNSKKKTILQL